MPREVWGYKPGPNNTVTQDWRSDFTPKKQPLSVKWTDPKKYAASPSLKSSTQGIIGRNPHVDSGIQGKPATGITYTEPKATTDLNAAIKKSRENKKDDDGGRKTYTDPCGGRCNGATQNCVGGRCVDKPGTGGDCGGKTCRSDQKCVNGQCKDTDTGPGEDKCDGVMHKGICHTRCEDTMGEEYTGTHPNCKLKSTGESVDGNGGGKGPSLNTILQPDQTPMLQTLTDEMDLRNMLGSVLNKNNPLFKQARTRALQAMAARGVVNSTMAEESVMTAIMNVAMPIATRVIDDFQRVMAANVNATNAFKAALNQAYYQELITRVDAANTWNLNSMAESSANWRERFGAFTGAKDIEDKPAFERYMAMITGSIKSKDWTAPTFP